MNVKSLCLVLSLLVFATAANAQQRRLKIYISADMEGVVGVVTNEQLGPQGFEYARFREFMTQEVNAAIEGAIADLANQAGQNKIAINFVWTLVSGFLVMFMQAGFAFVETGLCRAKNANHTMMMNFMVYGVGLLAYWLIGFAIQMGGVGAVGNLGATPVLNKEFAVELFGKPFGLFSQGYSSRRRRASKGGKRHALCTWIMLRGSPGSSPGSHLSMRVFLRTTLLQSPHPKDRHPDRAT